MCDFHRHLGAGGGAGAVSDGGGHGGRQKYTKTRDRVLRQLPEFREIV